MEVMTSKRKILLKATTNGKKEWSPKNQRHKVNKLLVVHLTD